MKIDISPEVHRAISIQASIDGTTIKALADAAISAAIDSEVWELVRKGKSTSSNTPKREIQPEAKTPESDPFTEAKRYILHQLEAGQEPTVAEVAAHVGMESRPLGVMMSKAGLQARLTGTGNRKKRRYTLDQIEGFRK